jgi:hypothetical protein
MEQRLTSEQLTQIVREVAQLSLKQQDELSQAEVGEILQELGLSPLLLEEAMVQIQRREALDRQQRQQKQILMGTIAVAAVAIAAFLWFTQRQQQTLAQVTAQGDRLTLAQDSGNTLSTVNRNGSSELYYRVTLKDAPIGQKLPLSCTWTDAKGQVVKQNSYETKPITTAVWPTSCRATLGPTAAPGTWRVQMQLQGRPVSDEQFEVR